MLNDEHGHAVGDEVLKFVSSVAHSELRGPLDRLGRWGGEEFIILLNSISSVQAHKVAQRLRMRIEAEIFDNGGVKTDVTASFGVSFVDSESCFDAAVSRADEALYQAKANGRNQVVLYTPVEIAA